MREYLLSARTPGPDDGQLMFCHASLDAFDAIPDTRQLEQAQRMNQAAIRAASACRPVLA